MKKVKLEIYRMLDTVSSTSAHYTIVLQESNGRRKLPIVIGQFEAQAIIIEIENLTPARPLTHDLFKSLADSYEITLEEVVIYKLKEGIYYSRLICMMGDVQKEIDSRTSDAIALALRFNCPIYVYESIISTAGVESASEGEEPDDRIIGIAESSPEPSAQQGNLDYSSLSEQELKDSLTQAINEEAYERASKIRDELNRRKK